MKQNKLLTELDQANSQILTEFYNLMKGVIYNRYNKSKGFQFALLDKNHNDLLPLISLVNEEILIRHFQEKQQQHRT